MPIRSGHTNGFHFTFSQLRSLHRLTERREDARRLLAGYPDGAEKNALLARFEQGEYQEVYDTLLTHATQYLPADFYVKDNGPLSPWPLEVVTDNPVWLTLLEVEETGYRLKVETKKATTLRITWPGHRICGTQTDGVLHLRTDATGEETFVYSLTPARQLLPKVIAGRILRLDGGIARVQSQDTSVTFYSDYIPLKVATDCCCYLAEDGAPERLAEMAEINDRMAVQLYTDGEQIQEIHAIRGEIAGTVTAVTEACIVGEIRLPTVTVTDGERTVTATIGSECALDFTGASGKALHISYIGRLGLTPGARVTLRYLPAVANGVPRALQISDL